MRWLVVAAVVACRTPDPTPPVVGGEAPAIVDGILRPPAARCVFMGPWHAPQPDALAFRTGDPPFAMFGAAARAQLGLTASDAFVFLEGSALNVRGFVARDEVQLHATRALVLADFVVPGPRAVLRPARMSSMRTRELLVAPVLPPHVTPLVAARALVECRALALSPEHFDPLAALAASAMTFATLSPGFALELRALPGGPPVAELRLDDDAAVTVLDQRGDWSRILLGPELAPLVDVAIVGWLPSSLLGPATPMRSGAGGFGDGRGVVRGRPASRIVHCPHPVDLAVTFGNERRIVGEIRVNAEIGIVRDGEDDSVEVTTARLGLVLADGARAFVDRRALAACAQGQVGATWPSEPVETNASGM